MVQISSLRMIRLIDHNILLGDGFSQDFTFVNSYLLNLYHCFNIEIINVIEKKSLYIISNLKNK